MRSRRRLRCPGTSTTGWCAQETRRILDRLYGYEVSPLLWRKVRPKLSAGRVQSVAVRMIVEEARADGVRVGHMVDLIGQFAKSNGQQLEAELVSVDGRRSVRQGFDPSTGKLKNAELMLLDAASAAKLAERIRSGQFGVITWKTSRTRHDRIHRSLPARCNKKPIASLASQRGGRCK